ncbi:MAG: redoxin family protein [Candidatus Eremiobacteraeota bacterium]|nr:redoxin family protein [Candidatus Eremiobacteraeota bacterium]MBV8371449.1 redoxin family protein [Candidatus Eremiobacteraeota bacterium]
MLHAIIAATALTLTGPQVGSPAPDFHLTTVAGKRVSLADFRGKTLVLNDWATWCPPCREETPDLIASAKKLATKGDVVFLGVDSTEAAPIVRAFLAAKPMPYTTAIDGDKAFSKAYDVRAFPTTFVISPDGVLRARYVGNITPAILAGFVGDARAGRDGVLATEAQKKADALLDPAKFAFTGDVDAVRTAAKNALKAIDDAENVDGETDYLRIQAEENVLRDAAAKALEPLAQSAADKALLARLQGDAAYAREEWPQAIAAYERGLAVAPEDPDLLSGYGTALRSDGDYARAAEAFAKLANADPSVENLVEYGNTAAGAKRFNDATVAFSRAVATARAKVDAKPSDAKAIRKLAWAYLYQGRMYAKAGENAKARAAFAQTSAWSAKLPKKDARHDMYLEEAQEATVALDAAHPAGKTAISLAPWTGPDLPGSVSSTYKYRLVVAGTPGKSVALEASGLPKRWVASFCSDRQCAPFRTTVALPSSGVKVIEFQVIPQSASAKPPTIRVQGGGASAAVRVGASA